MSNVVEHLKKLMEVSGTERQAKAQREQLEVAIADAMKEEMPAEGGTKTFECDGIRFEVKTGYRFSADIEAIKGLAFGEKLLKVKTEFSESAYRKLWEMNRAEAEQACPFVTATPSKPAVKVKEVTHDIQS